MTRPKQFAGLLFAILPLLGLVDAAHASVAIPYVQDFTTSAADFTTGLNTTGSSTATWTYNGSPTDTYALQLNRVSGASAYTYSSVTASPNLSTAANSSFYMSTVMEQMSNGQQAAANATVGLRFLADTTNTNTNAFAVDLNIGSNAGRVRAVEWVSGTATVDPSSTQTSQPLVSGFTLTDKYEMEVLGQFDSSDKLDLQVRMTDLTTSTVALAWTDLTPTTHYTLPSNIAAETYYSLFMSTSSGTSTTITTTFDSLTITPEPSTLLLAFAGSLGLLAKRRPGALSR